MARVEMQTLYLTFAGGNRVRGHIFVCVIWLEWNGWCLKVFCLAGLPFSSFFNQKEQPFLRALFVSVPLAFLGCWLLQYPLWDIYCRKITQGTCHEVTLQIPRSLTGLLSSFYLSEFSYVCFTYNVQDFYLYLVGGVGKIRTTTSFQEHKFFKVILILQTIPGL